MSVSGKRVLEVDSESATSLFRVLSSETRVLILSLLSHNAMNVSELTAALNLPHSTVSLNIKQLVGAGLLQVEYVPGRTARRSWCPDATTRCWCIYPV